MTTRCPDRFRTSDGDHDTPLPEEGTCSVDLSLELAQSNKSEACSQIKDKAKEKSCPEISVGSCPPLTQWVRTDIELSSDEISLPMTRPCRRKIIFQLEEVRVCDVEKRIYTGEPRINPP